MPVSSLFCGSAEDERVEFQEFCATRVAAVSQDIDWTEVMLPLQKQRLQDGVRQHGIGQVDHTGGVKHALIDLNQDPTKRKQIVLNPTRVGSTMFAFTHHGFVWDTEQEEPLLTVEWCLGHGMNSIPELSPDEVQPVDIRRLLRSGIVKHSKMREMVGLGWHEISMGSWLMFTLASIELKEPFQRLCKMQPTRIDDAVLARRRKRSRMADARAALGIGNSCKCQMHNFFNEQVLPIQLDD